MAMGTRAISIIFIHLSPLALFVRTTGAFTHHHHHHHHHQQRHHHHRRHYSATIVHTTTTPATTTTTINQSTHDIDDMWDPISQTYKNGIVPSHHSSISIEDLLASNNGKLRIFGYGSLCWHPGSDGVLSLANLEEDDDDVQDDQQLHHHAHHPDTEDGTEPKATRRKVSTMPGKAIGYQRCWSQRSADHRGTTEFNGIVCTLLSDEEVGSLRLGRLGRLHPPPTETEYRLVRRPSMTEGLIYTVDVDLVEDCLAELDFREKGGYARDVIDVVEDDTGNTVQALLYRGTPDNPAFWKRVLLDLPLAAGK